MFEPLQNHFTVDLSTKPAAARMLAWQAEVDAGMRPFMHGYWEWDWADEFVELTGVRKVNASTLDVTFYEDGPACKPNARWMGVNLLAELDVPGEYYIDSAKKLLYFLPPDGEVRKPVILTYKPGAVVNVTSAAANTTLSDLEICYGRHVGLDATGARGLVLERLNVHDHGTHGILLADARDSFVHDCDVIGVGCIGIRATGGDAATLTQGNVSVTNSRVTAPAQWKRSYQPGIFFGGVGNTYRSK